MGQKPAPIPVRTPELEAEFARQGQIVTTGSGCHLWCGPLYMHGGYGRFYVSEEGRSYRAHRVAYAWKYGDTEKILDHTCHDPEICFALDVNGWCSHRRCVNPDHLDPTSRGENVRRGLPGSPLWSPVGNSLKTHCDHGHEFTPENTYTWEKTGWRQCKICKAADAAASYEALTEEGRDALNAKRRGRRAKVVYPERKCDACNRDYQPLRSTSRLCRRKDCINERQRLNRNKRLGREEA